MTLYAKRKAGFHNMRPERARALSRRGTRTLVELADDYAHTYAPFIQAAVREVGQNYRQVAKWLTRERIPAQRNGQWKAQSVKKKGVPRSALYRPADAPCGGAQLPLCANSRPWHLETRKSQRRSY
jgi:hypothetical protein